MNTSTELDINSVRAFWDEKPCQADLSQAEDRRRYFEEISQRRYGRREWHQFFVWAVEWLPDAPQREHAHELSTRT